MNNHLIEQIRGFAIAARVPALRACHLLGLMTDGHDKVLHLWLTEELPVPECIYEFIELCTLNPKRQDLNDTEWWKTRQGHFSDGMHYIYGDNPDCNVYNIAPAQRIITPQMLGADSIAVDLQVVNFGGFPSKLWTWLISNGGDKGWIAQAKITKRFQSTAKSEEIKNQLDAWIKEGKLESEKTTPPAGRASTFYRIKQSAPAQEQTP